MNFEVSAAGVAALDFGPDARSSGADFDAMIAGITGDGQYIDHWPWLRNNSANRYEI